MKCRECGIELGPERERNVRMSNAKIPFCDVCCHMVLAIGKQPGLFQAAKDYALENKVLAFKKLEMMRT